MDRTIDTLFIFNKTGSINAIEGTYTDYLDTQKKEEIVKKETQKEIKSKKEESKKRLTYNEKKELNTIEKEIEKLEKEQEILTQKVTDTNDYEKTGKELKDITQKIEKKYKRWDELSKYA